MAWMARLAGWSALLAFPCWLLMPAYQPMLGSLASLALRIFGIDVQFDDVMVAAPFDLALFTAMCLASLRVPRPRRMRSLLIGIPILVAGEVLVVAVVVVLTMAAPSSAQSAMTTSRAASYLAESIPWVNAAAAWLVMLGKDELPELSRAPAKRSGMRMAR